RGCGERLGEEPEALDARPDRQGPEDLRHRRRSEEDRAEQVLRAGARGAQGRGLHAPVHRQDDHGRRRGDAGPRMGAAPRVEARRREETAHEEIGRMATKKATTKKAKAPVRKAPAKKAAKKKGPAKKKGSVA